MPAPAIVFDQVGLTFGGKPLFDDLSFTVEAGRCTCLLGPSGCGKSTILKLIAGNTSLSHTGTIRYPDEDNQGSATAWMAQEDLLLPWLEVLDNVLLGARLRGELSSELRQKATTLLHNAGLGSFLHVLPGTLSGGMRQRVALLRTLMEERQVLLMDEPFSALDALTRIKLQDISAELTRGATVLLVTHDPMEALRMGNRLLVLSGDPVAITSDILLDGTPPRTAHDPEIAQRYPALLELLLAGDRP